MRNSRNITKEKLIESLSEKQIQTNFIFKTKYLDPLIIPEIIKPFRKMDLDKFLLSMKQKENECKTGI